jgi:septum formation protein
MEKQVMTMDGQYGIAWNNEDLPLQAAPEELDDAQEEERMLVLASASPRRREILQSHGVECTVVAPKVDEHELMRKWESSGRGNVADLVMELAHLKAQTVLEMLQSGAVSVPDAAKHILAADTLVVCGRILGKPRTEEEAFAMLMELSGKSHEVYTGVALIERHTNTGTLLYDRSVVSFDAYDETAACTYVLTGEPLDKAGAYAIQGLWAEHVTQISGDYENIVGLPWHHIQDLI